MDEIAARVDYWTTGKRVFDLCFWLGAEMAVFLAVGIACGLKWWWRG